MRIEKRFGPKRSCLEGRDLRNEVCRQFNKLCGPLLPEWRATVRNHQLHLLRVGGGKVVFEDPSLEHLETELSYCYAEESDVVAATQAASALADLYSPLSPTASVSFEKGDVSISLP